MVHLYRLIVAFLLACFSLHASAALTPVVQYRDSLNRVDTASGLVAWWQAYDPKFACGGPSLDKPATWEARNVTPQQFDLYKVGSYCNDQGTYNTLTQSPTAAGSACPANSSASGGSCTCNTGYDEINGSCEPRNNNRTACWNWSLQNVLPGGELVTTQRLQGKIAHGTQFCTDIGSGYGIGSGKGCKVTFDLEISMGYGSESSPQYVSEGKFDFASNGNTVDQSCNLGPGEQPKPVPPEEKCPNGYTGTVNGVEVCINKVPDSGADGGSSETETNDGTETTTRRVDRSTNCEGDKCTTTTTTTTTRRNNSTGATTTTTTTSTSTTSKPGFCQENPSSKLCKDGKEDGSSFGGSCSGGFTCEGDAIQCAMAQEQHRRACKLFDDKDSPEYKLYDAEKNKTGKVTGTLEGNRTVNIGTTLSTTDQFLGGGGTCPADDVIDLGDGQTFAIPYSKLCPFLAMLGNVLLIVASISSVFIIIKRGA
ncbi:hypothetical protein C8C99_0888 [Acidovorax sp. 107]|uniref:virulence factor TspB C-terminal domain-related protein n=1 Tax=Acidovorax sp. 107 TaxID=2135638 RepID=UPI000D4BDC3E|nr:virulence factor TspB C-terminal domain-related protein [Acidovorax sp. 107]PUA96082.1 hypothetical protein C8C99_0888 [Acidovorax sp. 107]